MDLFPHLVRNSLGTLTWVGLKMTEDFIRYQTVILDCGEYLKPRIPNFSGKQSAVSWAKCHGLLPNDTKDAHIKVIERRMRN